VARRERHHRSSVNPIQKDAPIWDDPPRFVEKDTLLFWVMLEAEPETELLLAEEEDAAGDVTRALREFKRKVRTRISADEDFTQMFVGVDRNQRDSDKKKTTESFLKHLHSDNFDTSMHAAVPTFLANHHRVTIIIYDKHGFRSCYESDQVNDKSKVVLTVRQMVNSRFQILRSQKKKLTTS
jgi:hypothetical protein